MEFVFNLDDFIFKQVAWITQIKLFLHKNKNFTFTILEDIVIVGIFNHYITTSLLKVEKHKILIELF